MKKIILLSLFCSWALSKSYVGLPFISKLSGLDPMYGAIGGIQNLYQPGFSLNAAYSFGSIEGFGILAKDYPLFNKTKFSLGYVRIDEAKYETNYGRGFESTEFYNQKLKFSALRGSLKKKFNKHSFFEFSYSLSNRTFLGYEDLDEKEIPISMKNFYKESAAIIGIKYKKEKRNYAFSVDVNRLTDRKGQSDMTNVDIVATRELFINRQNKLRFAYKSSHSAVSKEYKTSANEVDGDCELISDSTKRAKCLTLESDVNKFIQKHNTKGTAKPLGGNFGMRSFRELEFKSSHNLMLSFELERQMFHPYFFVTPFIDLGHAQDAIENIFDQTRYSTGLSFRYYFKPKLPVRLTGAYGSTGAEYFLSAGLPW